MENYGKSFIRNRNNRLKKISSKQDAVIKRATVPDPCHENFWKGQKNFFGPKCLISGEQQYFHLGHCFSKHKMTRYAKNLGGMAP